MQEETEGKKTRIGLRRRDCQIIISLLNSWSGSIITEGECFPGAFASIPVKRADWMWCRRGKQQVGLTLLIFTRTFRISNNSEDKITSFQAVVLLCVLFLRIPQKSGCVSSCQAVGCGMDEASGLLWEISPSSVTLSQSSLRLPCLNQSTYLRA